jgi:hypothetical protein
MVGSRTPATARPDSRIAPAKDGITVYATRRPISALGPKQPPVVLQQCSLVIDVEKFISATLAPLRARLEGKDFPAGNWQKRELIERLEQVGIEVEVNDDHYVEKSPWRNEKTAIDER